MCVGKKLLKIQQATRSLQANAEGQTGAARYNYVSGSKLLSIIRPKMDELGLILTQEVIGIDNQLTTYPTSKGNKTEMFTTIHLRFTWLDAEDGSTIVNEFFANGMNAFDKGLGSALTYAERYYLMKTFHIATDEDDVDALVKEEAIEEPVKKEELPVLAKGTEDWESALAYVGKGHHPKNLRKKRTISDEDFAELETRYRLIQDLNAA